VKPTRRSVVVSSFAVIATDLCGVKLDAQQQPVGTSPAGQAALEAVWRDLEKDEANASRALLALTDRPAEAVAFLKERLKPAKIDGERVKVLLFKLGSKDDATWKPAFEELEYYDPRLAIGLETLMEDVRASPARQRLVAVLSGRDPGPLEGKQIELRKSAMGRAFNFVAQPGGAWWADVDVKLINSQPGRNPKRKWTRAVRAIAFLEHAGTPDAVAIVKRMCFGHEEAQPTVEARRALSRINQKRQ
jgi:hypothetical protein